MSHDRLDPKVVAFADGRSLSYGSGPLVMGIVNITPDSFSDGGECIDPQRAVARGLELLEQGADLLDLGAESTRPGGGIYGEGASPLSVREECDRLLPVLEGLREATSAPISIDTRKGAVARRALAEGADLLNDIEALADPESRRAAAEAGCPVVLMHSRGSLATMQRDILFEDVLEEVVAELSMAIERAVDDGVERGKILIDPGIGFGKRTEHNLSLLRHLDTLSELAPVLLGASRKSFISEVGGAASPQERLGGSLAAVAWAANCGIAMVRVHDVSATRQFLDVWQAIASQDSRSITKVVEEMTWS